MRQRLTRQPFPHPTHRSRSSNAAHSAHSSGNCSSFPLAALGPEILISRCPSSESTHRILVRREGKQRQLRTASVLAITNFGTQPLPPGVKRRREPWELPWLIGMFGSFAFITVALYYKPDTRCVSTFSKASTTMLMCTLTV